MFHDGLVTHKRVCLRWHLTSLSPMSTDTGMFLLYEPVHAHGMHSFDLISCALSLVNLYMFVMPSVIICCREWTTAMRCSSNVLPRLRCDADKCRLDPCIACASVRLTFIWTFYFCSCHDLWHSHNLLVLHFRHLQRNWVNESELLCMMSLKLLTGWQTVFCTAQHWPISQQCMSTAVLIWHLALIWTQ